MNILHQRWKERQAMRSAWLNRAVELETLSAELDRSWRRLPDVTRHGKQTPRELLTPKADADGAGTTGLRTSRPHGAASRGPFRKFFRRLFG